MKIITRQSLANDASRRWKKACKFNRYGHPQNAKAIQRKLDALGKIKDPDKVDAILGGSTWTALPVCYECNTSPKDLLIELTESNDDYEDITIWLCKSCLEKAWNAVQVQEEAYLASWGKIEKQLQLLKKQIATMEPQNEEARVVLQAVHTFEVELEKLLKKYLWAFIELD